MDLKEIKIGMIASYEPMDRYEWGVVYDLDPDGCGGMAAFIDQCSSWNALCLRHVSIDGDCVVVRNHRDAKLREARICEYEHADNQYDMSEEQSLAQVLKVLAKNPLEVDVYLDNCTFKRMTDREMLKEKRKTHKAIYDMLASDDCEWLRKLWPHLASSWKEFDDSIK